ncbi:MAG: hypothetical protein GTN74_08110 [Proteobacteria bacterium]|nr:hypothetical protein [Pseudomonadota bacterium]
MLYFVVGSRLRIVSGFRIGLSLSFSFMGFHWLAQGVDGFALMLRGRGVKRQGMALFQRKNQKTPFNKIDQFHF